MVCKNCGKELPNGAAFCDACGMQINYSAQQQGQQFVPPQAPQPVYVQQQFINKKNMPVPPTTIGQYLGWFLLSIIPLVGFIISIVFAVDDSDMNRANYFRASLIWMAILVVLGIIFGVIVGIFGFSALRYYL